MRKDTKRALLIWPMLASSVMSMGLWVQSQPQVVEASLAQVNWTAQLAKAQLAETWSRNLPDSFWSQAATPVAYPSDFERDVIEPSRSIRPVVPAPIRHESRELAGLDLQLDDLAHETQATSKKDVATGIQPAIRPQSTLHPPAIASNRESIKLAESDTPPSLSLESMRRRDSISSQSRQDGILDQRLLELLPPVISAPSSTRLPSKSASVRDHQSSRTSVAEVVSTDAGDNVHVGDLPRVAKDVQDSIKKSDTRRHAPSGWPRTPRLDKMIESLGQMANDSTVSLTRTDRDTLITWGDEVRQAMETLHRQQRLGEPSVEPVLSELKQLADQGLAFGETLDDHSTRVKMLSSAHALNRRVAVWIPIYQLNRQQLAKEWMVTDAADRVAINYQRLSKELADAIKVVDADLRATGDTDRWREFLMLDKLRRSARGPRLQQGVVAQQFLSRLQWHSLGEEQIRWLERDSVIELSKAVRPLTSQAIDYAQLLRQIERQESDAIDLAAIDIASTIQSLRFSDQPRSIEVAKSLNQHYRNANVRLALSDKILNRLLPEVTPKTVPVRTRILGTNVHGVSQIHSQLSVSLTPSTDRWTLQLKTRGDVSTRSTGLNGPVSLRTTGSSQFQANRPIEITPSGVRLGDVNVDVHGRTKLRGIRSDYDGWPLIGALVRSVANKQYDAKQGRSNQIASNMIRSQVASEVEVEVDGRVDEARDKLTDMVLGPLGKLKLDPQVTDMQTTDQRLIARYRLAGDWQLGAFTPRPRAPSSSLMSVQTHQSAINNFLEQLIPRDRAMTIQEIVDEATGVFDRQVEVSNEIPEDITIQFARTRPITAEIEDGRLWLTMRVVKLQRSGRKGLTNFIVRAAYRPEVNGLRASLVRDGHLRISGPGMSMRERLPIRTVFNKVLSSERSFPLTLPALANHPAMDGLAISQLELRDGWIGMAFSEDSAPKIAWETTLNTK